MDNRFLKVDLASLTLSKGAAVGVGDASLLAVRRALLPQNMQKMDGSDSMSKGSPYVVECISSPSVDAIRKIHAAGPRRETGDTLTRLRKSVSGPALRDVQLPGQSSNGAWTTAPASRVGGAPGVADVDQMFGAQRAPVSGPRSASAESSPGTPPEDSDVPDKRKPRSKDRARRALQRDSIEEPLDYVPDGDDCSACDATTKAIRAIHKRGPRPLFQR